jgi:tetratricopeptide (TPR) repeat protein
MLMSLFRSPISRALGLTIACVGVATAQAQKECSVNENRPTQVGKAMLAVQVALSAQDPNSAARQLSSAVKGLTENAERMDNQVGRNFVLGKALSLWLAQPDMALEVKRGALGYASNPDATISLPAAIDTAFKVVETAMPECVVETSKWRGHKGWIALVNKAIEAANSTDEAGMNQAEMLAREAIVVNPYGPYGYVILGQVMQRKSKTTEAIAQYKKGIEVALKDSVYDDIRRQAVNYMGAAALDSAESVTDTAARRPYLIAAKSAFEQIIADKGSNESKKMARQGMCRVATVSGDTALLRSVYKGELLNPAGFSYSEIMDAGVCMANAEMITDAQALFRTAYEKNSYHRDALSNLAVMLIRSNKDAEAIPLAERLVEVEPNNPDNWQLLTTANANIARATREQRQNAIKAAQATKTGSKTAPATKTAAGTKTATKSAGTGTVSTANMALLDSLFNIEKKYTDAAVAANTMREKIVYKVTITEFTPTEAKATFSGSISNGGSEAKPITLKVDFLDNKGKVVQSKEQAFEQIPAGRSTRFSLTATPGKEIAAFRYAKID